MVTFAFFLTGILLFILTVSFDLLIFHYSLKKEISHLFTTDIATGRYIVLVGLAAGLVAAIITDVRLYRRAKNQGSSS